MPEVELLSRLAANNAWSNHRLHAACAKLSAADLEAPRTSFFPSLTRTLNHILIVDWYYLDAFERGGRGLSIFDDETPFREMEAITEAQREADRRLLSFTAGMKTPEDSAAAVHMQRRGRVQVERAVDVLMHLFVHQIHHRGQVHAMLSGTPVPPPQLDEFFMSEELPLREAELRDLGLTVR